MTQNTFINCPNGSVDNQNWGRADQALIIDVAAYLTSKKQMRNVAMARTVNVGSGNVVTDMSFSLPNNGNLPPAVYEFTAPNGNITTFVTSVYLKLILFTLIIFSFNKKCSFLFIVA